MWIKFVCGLAGDMIKFQAYDGSAAGRAVTIECAIVRNHIDLFRFKWATNIT